MISRVEGIAFRGELPARSVTLRHPPGVRGKLVVERTRPGSDAWTYVAVPPDFVEIADSEDQVRALLQPYTGSTDPYR
jgi:hypothetical protein